MQIMPFISLVKEDNTNSALFSVGWRNCKNYSVMWIQMNRGQVLKIFIQTKTSTSVMWQMQNCKNQFISIKSLRIALQEMYFLTVKTYWAFLNPNVLLPQDCEAVYLPAAHHFNKELLTFTSNLLSRLPAVANKNSDRIYTKIQIQRDRHLWKFLNFSEMKCTEKTLVLLAKTRYIPDPVSQSQITIQLVGFQALCG